MIRKNPFKFKLSDVIPKDAFVRTALTRSNRTCISGFSRSAAAGAITTTS